MSGNGTKRALAGPILVTGMPRSGTTWLARLIATAPGTALAGREPMNPRGRQYALARTVPGWVELTTPTAKQRRALRAAYGGRTPWVYSRYGRRQWAAPLPWTRLVVKDPFAMLSLPAVVQATGARPVLLYRHPGAALASYRRMGWTPDTAELAPIIDAHRARLGTPPPPAVGPRGAPEGAAEEMGRFWADLYEMALDNIAGLRDVVVVSHEEIAGGGPEAGVRLFAALGLDWSAEAAAELAADGSAPRPGESGGRQGALHDSLSRAPREVAEAWRAALTADEVESIEAVTAAIRERLDGVRLRLVAS